MNIWTVEGDENGPMVKKKSSRIKRRLEKNNINAVKKDTYQ
jgi:hypothetical protein